MNARQAIAKLRPILGSKFAYRIDAKALDAEGRAEASELFRDLRDKAKAVDEALQARRAELLKDSQYQALRAEHAALVKDRDSAAYYAHHKRIMVGIDGGMFWHVKAEGDTWADVVEKLTTKEVPA